MSVGQRLDVIGYCDCLRHSGVNPGVTGVGGLFCEGEVETSERQICKALMEKGVRKILNKTMLNGISWHLSIIICTHEHTVSYITVVLNCDR